MGDDEHDSDRPAVDPIPPEQRTLQIAASYSWADAVRLTGASASQVTQLARQVTKRGVGAAMDFDDLVRLAVGRELLRVRQVDLSTLHELFAAIDQPGIRGAHRWAWLRTDDARQRGAALVLVLHAGRDTGAVMLATADEAVELAYSDRRVVVVDVSACIAELEQRTGIDYVTLAATAYVH